MKKYVNAASAAGLPGQVSQWSDGIFLVLGAGQAPGLTFRPFSSGGNPMRLHPDYASSIVL